MTPTLRAFPRRRGSVYVLVLMSAAMLTVVGIGVATITRTQIRTDGLDRDVERASRMAISAAHAGIAWMNSNPDWRERHATAIANGEVPDFGHFKLTQEAGGAECKWWFDDGSGGPVPTDPLATVRVIGLGRSGRAQRVLTVLVQGDLSATAAILRSGIHSNAILLLKSTTIFDGPASSNTSITSESDVVADIEAPTFTLKSGTQKGSLSVPAPSKYFPPATGTGSPFDTLWPLAATIPFASLPGSNIDKRIIGPGINPFGSGHAEGIYRLSVPAGKTTQIRNSRIRATLLVELADGAKLDLRDALLWDPPSPDLPALIVRGTKGEVVIQSQYTKTLSEPSEKISFNPSGAPYGGTSDSDQTDLYPSHLNGLFYVGGAVTVKIGTDVRINGCVLAESAIETDKLMLRADPSLAVSPPRGFRYPGHAVSVVAGSWRQPPFAEIALAEPGSGADKSVDDDEVIKK